MAALVECFICRDLTDDVWLVVPADGEPAVAVCRDAAACLERFAANPRGINDTTTGLIYAYQKRVNGDRRGDESAN